jgi:hypothetical protein
VSGTSAWRQAATARPLISCLSGRRVRARNGWWSWQGGSGRGRWRSSRRWPKPSLRGIAHGASGCSTGPRLGAPGSDRRPVELPGVDGPDRSTTEKGHGTAPCSGPVADRRIRPREIPHHLQGPGPYPPRSVKYSLSGILRPTSSQEAQAGTATARIGRAVTDGADIFVTDS